MFRRRAPRTDAVPAGAGQPQGEAFSYIHEGTVVRGAIEASGRLRVHGTVLGDVRVEGVLEVARGGLVEGATVAASEVRVLGTVRAAVTATAKVEIWKDGTIEGDVATAALDIEEGATFVGRSVMTSRGRADGVPDGVPDGAEEGPPALASEAGTAPDAAPAAGGLLEPTRG
jgi:cytoskeletal protein CcmA (bactofilin family)